jgi:alpha-galactosidase
MAKIAIIGAGSITFTRRLVMDIMTVPELQDTSFSFMDISEEYLERVTKLMRKILEDNGITSKIEPTLNQREAISGADYVISVARVGGLDAFAKDIEIPLKYGVDQCVGDTLGPGGVFYALRTIPVLLDIASDMRELAAPDALFLNYSNPMAMNCWAVRRAGGVRIIGLCHGVQNGHQEIAEALQLPQEDVDYVCAGINHQTWYIQVTHRGIDMLPFLVDAFEAHPELSKHEKVRIDVMKRFGYYSTESNGHLSEYVPWYRKRPDEIDRWISYDSWIHGPTAGYLNRVREMASQRDDFVEKYLAGELETL